MLLVSVPVLGGAWGALVASVAAYRTYSGDIRLESVSVAFLIMFIFITGSGLLYVHDPRQIKPLLIALAYQIPSVSLPMFEYQLAAGLNLAVLFGPPPATGEGILSFKLIHHIGVVASYRFEHAHEGPWGVGVNLFAAFLFVVLWLSSSGLSTQVPE